MMRRCPRLPLLDGESVSAVAVAPFVEETMKGLGVLLAVRRRELEGAMDGIVIAGWVALGFAVVEDMIFFGLGAEEGELLQSFLLRGLITPFAHPMVTFWTGLALGIAVYRRRPLAWALWGTRSRWRRTRCSTERGSWPVCGCLRLASRSTSPC